MAVIELADGRSVGRAENGAIRAVRVFRVDGGVTDNPPTGIPQIPEMGAPHPSYQGAYVRSIDWQPVSDYGWNAVITYSNVESGSLGPIIPEANDIGKYRFGWDTQETSVQMPVARLAKKAMPQSDGGEVTVDAYETILFQIPQGAMGFTVEVTTWAPNYLQTITVLNQTTRIHQFGGPNGLKFRFIGGTTQYLGQRGEGTDPALRDVVRFVYRWVQDSGTVISEPRGLDGESPPLVTPRKSFLNPDGGPLTLRLDRPPFAQWVVIPNETAKLPPQFELLSPYTEDLDGWEQLPGMEYARAELV